MYIFGCYMNTMKLANTWRFQTYYASESGDQQRRIKMILLGISLLLLYYDSEFTAHSFSKNVESSF